MFTQKRYTSRRVTRVGGRGGVWEVSPALFSKSEKVPDFGGKCPDYIHLWVKFLIYNAVLRASRKKIS